MMWFAFLFNRSAKETQRTQIYCEVILIKSDKGQDCIGWCLLSYVIFNKRVNLSLLSHATKLVKGTC